MKKRRRNIFIFISLIIISFHALWLIQYRTYSTLLKNNYFKKDGCWIKKYNDEYYSSVCLPRYPSFVGNYIVASYKGDISLIIWPPNIFSSDWELGIDMYDTKKEHGYRFYINENYEFDEKNKSGLEQRDYKIAKRIYSKLAERVKRMSSIAEKEFPGMSTMQRNK